MVFDGTDGFTFFFLAEDVIRAGHVTGVQTCALPISRQHHMALVVPWFEEAQTGVYYNSAAVIENDGTLLGKYRKTHIPQVQPCFFEKYYFKPGNLGYPVWHTSAGRVGLIICYDRH